MDPAGLERVVRLVRARGAAARLVVLRNGKPALNRSFGCDPDGLFLLLSVSKPYVALLVHLLAERGAVRLDDPVSAYWPEYARHGKDTTTIRHVLTHRSGVPLASGSLVGDAAAMAHWRRAVRQVERARPRWPPGAVPAYHVLSFGVILGELVQRVTGAPVADVLRTELLAPLGLRDTHLGLPDRLWYRHVPLQARGLARSYQLAFNRRQTRRAIIPAAGISSTATDLAVFYDMLLTGGRRDGVRVLRPDTVAEATRPSADGERDRIIGCPVRWAHGFQLGGQPGMVRPLGTRSHPTAFGHPGSGVCLAWADPTRRLVAVYLTDLVTARRHSLPHQCALSDTILSATRT